MPLAMALTFKTNVNQYCKFIAEDMQIIGTFALVHDVHPLSNLLTSEELHFVDSQNQHPFFNSLNHVWGNWIEWEKCAKMLLNMILTFNILPSIVFVILGKGYIVF